jgi:hypothetical protein
MLLEVSSGNADEDRSLGRCLGHAVSASDAILVQSIHAAVA